MTPLSILALAIGLAMDAMAVSAARGLATTQLRPRHYFLVALYFGAFQALMPLLGWLLGSVVGHAVDAWAHWIAFALLSFLGGKMLWEARTQDADEAPSQADLFGHRTMLGLAVATSIDALAVGVTLPMLHAPLVLTITTIGVVTALLSALGLYLGRRVGSVLGKRIDVAGGVVLIALGISMLVT